MVASLLLSDDFSAAAQAERERLRRESEVARAEVERLRVELAEAEAIALMLTQKIRAIEEVLGLAPQLSIAELDGELRGARLREVALAILREEVGGEPVHYKRWYELVVSRHRVAGKDPLATFLAAVSRISGVERVGRRSGIYRLRPV
jgi:hypothetical protein